jgi:hypothetical protein
MRTSAGALFAGGAGIPSCNFDGELCFGGDFLIESGGFPAGFADHATGRREQ